MIIAHLMAFPSDLSSLPPRPLVTNWTERHCPWDRLFVSKAKEQGTVTCKDEDDVYVDRFNESMDGHDTDS